MEAVLKAANLAESINIKVRAIVKSCTRDMLGNCLQSRSVKAGFKETGVFPYNAEQMLSKVRGVQTWPKDLAVKVRKGIKTVTELAK